MHTDDWRMSSFFGFGYGVERLAGIDWLRLQPLHYWGDIDTHGFAILDGLRADLPHVESFLMDRETLMGHRRLWTREHDPYSGGLPRLNGPEQSLYDDLRYDRFGEHIRLEQERIPFQWVMRALRPLLAG